MRKHPCLVVSVLVAVLAVPGVGAAAVEETNLLALGAGALPVVEPPAYGGWPAIHLLDDAPASGWACENGKIANNVFVFELPAKATLTAFEFDTASIDTAGSAAKDVTVEVSAASRESGFQPVLRASLKEKADNQRFAAQAMVEGGFVRLTILDNHGAVKWTELFGFRGLGARTEAVPIPNLSGTYDTNYNKFHLRQQGTALTGCYEYNEGLFDGTVEGRVMQLTWVEGSNRGPAVFVFAPDGRAFRGTWWRGTDKGTAPAGEWTGTRASAAVGGCPHWSGSVSGELRKGLAASGRVRLYGILFDTDKATIKPESLPTLDEVVTLMGGEPQWQLTVEGHTDATGAAAHNQTLSEQRAAAVKVYLVAKGVAGSRLATAGFGASKPVSDNATELGRAQNRRVELVRR
jgi:outer membrane protein OmpA-like peptidoglycan-associated protein